MHTRTDPASLTNENLLVEVMRAAANERRATAQLIALLAEVDARRLYLRQGCSSLYTYCTQVLRLSEDAAYFRMEAARAARSYPIILEMLIEATLTPTVVRLLRPHLTPENHREVLESARHKSKREIEELVARLRPQPAVSAWVRKLPSAKATATMAPLTEHSRDVPATQSTADATAVNLQPVVATVAHSKPAVVKPLAPERYKVQFTISAGTQLKLRQVQDLLRHRVPNGDPAEIFDRALTLLLEQLQRTRLAAAKRPRQKVADDAQSRYIPASVRREVWTRDGGRCAFIGTQGRCTETGSLEFHHVEPYAAGGAATSQNLQLRCRAHNAYEADLFLGRVGPTMVRESRASYAARSAGWPEPQGARPKSVTCSYADHRDHRCDHGRMHAHTTMSRQALNSAEIRKGIE